MFPRVTCAWHVVLAQKLGLFPSAHAIAMGDKEYHGAVNIGATMKARYNAWQHRVSFHVVRARRRAAMCPVSSAAFACVWPAFASPGCLLHIKSRQTLPPDLLVGMCAAERGLPLTVRQSRKQALAQMRVWGSRRGGRAGRPPVSRRAGSPVEGAVAEGARRCMRLDLTCDWTQGW